MNVLLKQNMNKMSESELYDALYKDPVFECYNRRAFMEVESKWVVVVDVDSLKWLNDTYGHRVGDHYMKEVIDALIKEFGEDSVFRLGGDEFAVKTNIHHMNVKVKLANLQSRLKTFSYGMSYSVDSADTALNIQKQVRESLGLRSPRGEMPPWSKRVESEMTDNVKSIVI